MVLSPRDPACGVGEAAQACRHMLTTDDPRSVHGEMHQWNRVSDAMAGALFRFRCPPREGNQLIPILERIQLSSELKEVVGGSN